MRKHVARTLVRFIGFWFEMSYQTYWSQHKWYQKAFGGVGFLFENLLLPLALRLDYRAAGQQMVKEGWWG